MVFFFRSTTPKQQMDIALREGNAVVLDDFGPNHEFDLEDPPDLLVLIYENIHSRHTAVGLLALHYTEASRVWELGSMSARKTFSHGRLFSLFMDKVPRIILEHMHDVTDSIWIVKRVMLTNRKHIEALKCMGFVEPPHFLIGVLSNDGYIPFDPFDEVLMKRQLNPVVST